MSINNFSLLIAVVCTCFFLSPLAQAEQTRWEAVSLQRYFKATLTPEKPHYRIGEYHNWIITIKNIDGKPIDNAKIAIGGGMQGHGHGLPSQPIVTKNLNNGRYLIEGMLFNMAGEWTLLFAINTPMLTDQVRFDFDLSF